MLVVQSNSHRKEGPVISLLHTLTVKQPVAGAEAKAKAKLQQLVTWLDSRYMTWNTTWHHRPLKVFITLATFPYTDECKARTCFLSKVPQKPFFSVLSFHVIAMKNVKEISWGLNKGRLLWWEHWSWVKSIASQRPDAVSPFPSHCICQALVQCCWLRNCCGTAYSFAVEKYFMLH